MRQANKAECVTEVSTGVYAKPEEQEDNPSPVAFTGPWKIARPHNTKQTFIKLNGNKTFIFLALFPFLD